MSDWERVGLCAQLEQAFAGVRIDEALVWLHTTTLGDLYRAVEAQLSTPVPRELASDDEPYAQFAALVGDSKVEALLFAGQGAQYVGMCVELCAENERARRLFERASAIVGFDVLQLCRDGPLERLSETSVCQIALLVADVAALEKLPEARKRRVAACAGLSLGEYAALVFAEAVSFDDAVRVVHARALAMQAAAERTATGLASVLGLDDSALEALLAQCNSARSDSPLTIANYLAPGNRALGGAQASLDAMQEIAASHQAKKVARLNVSGAFHTAHMQPAQAALAAAIEAAEWRMPRLPVVSNVTALPYASVAEIKQTLVRHVVEPVRWQQSIEHMLDALHVSSFVELGCGSVLTGLLRHILRARAAAAPVALETASV